MSRSRTLLGVFLLFSLSAAQISLIRQEACPINTVCYVLDQSGSISSSEYLQEQNFVIEVADKVGNESSSITFNAAIAFASSAQVIQTPTTNFTEFEAAIRQPRLFRGGTAISAGLTSCASLIDSRPGNRVIVLLTDGFGDEAASIQVADAAKANGIDIITVGIGSSVSEDFLRQIATAPSFFLSAEFGVLEQDIPGLVQAICTIPDAPDIPEVSDAPDMPIGDACEEAFDKCDFMFAGIPGLTTFNVTGEPDIAFTPRIVAKDVMVSLGVLNTNSIIPEFIEEDGNVAPVTDFGNQPFTPTVFKPYWVAQDRGSGIGHETYQGNQESIIGNRCVRVFLSHFQESGQNGLVNRNDVPRSDNKCVVFRTL